MILYKALIISLLAFLYSSLGKFSFCFLAEGSFVSIGLFAAEGIALAFVLFFGRAVIPGIFIGQYFLAKSNGLDIDASLAIAFVNSFEAYLASIILTKLRLDIKLQTFRDFVLLFGTILFILQPVSAFVSNAYLVFDGDILPQEYFHSSIDWLIGNVIGQFLFTPFVLLFLQVYRRIDIFFFIWFSVFVGLLSYSFMILIEIENPFLLFALTLPFAIAVVSRYSLFYGIYLNTIVALIAAYSVQLKLGAFYVHSQGDNVLNYDLLILTHVIIVIIIGVLFDERKRHILTLQDEIDKEVEKNKRQQLFLLQQSRLAQMGEMIAMIAHQWRQPLNSLSLLVQVVEQKQKKNKIDDVFLTYFKTNATRLITHMSTTIDEFKEFFKPNKEKSIFLLSEMINDTVHIIEPALKSAQVTLNLSITEDMQVNSFKNELGQALINILNNARDILIENDVQDKIITIRLEKNEGSTSIFIADNAGGIPPEIIENIFDPYFSTKTEKNGTGLGLYMTKIIIEEHCKGSLSVQNVADGAEFAIALTRG